MFASRTAASAAALLVVISVSVGPAHLAMGVVVGSVVRRSDVGLVYRPPVPGPITEQFQPPTGPYGPGHRGVDYATAPGTPVGAAAAGVVVFAGAVGGGLYVTVLHPDGIRTSYSYLAAVRVQKGQAVTGGEVVGVAAALLHVGARRGAAYIDPASLWGQAVRPPEVHLVPLDGYRSRSLSLPGPAVSNKASPRPPSGLPALATAALRAAAAGVG